MVEVKLAEEQVPIPSDVKVAMAGREITVEGAKGKVKRVMDHPSITIEMGDGVVSLSTSSKSKAACALLGTYRAHLLNMFRGVTKGFEHRMKVVYSHFPISVSVKGKTVLIENFLGEKSPRTARVVGDTKVTVKGGDITLTGPDIEDVGQSAANIERATRIKGYDPRVFQDGIYIVKKGSRKED
ncbi:MAG: 50S ribosomal protein L6 [Candidatus Thermoplasmatota archaeon]